MNPPVADLIYPQNASEESLQKAQFELQRFIDSIKDPSWKVMTDICDMDSLARYYWIQEVSMNFDSWDRSVYMYYLKNDKKIHMGPVWDMDLTLGYSFNRYGLKFDKPEGWITREHGWYDKLFEDKEFRRTVRDVYFNGGVRDAFIDGIEDFINSREQLGEDAYYSFLMYGYSNRGYTLNYGDTYDEYCDNMIEFYKKRLAWIDTMMNASENM